MNYKTREHKEEQYCFVAKFKTGENFAAVSGGFNPNVPIKLFTLDTSNNNVSNNLKSEIKIKDNSTSIFITHYHDEIQQKTYLFDSIENVDTCSRR